MIKKLPIYLIWITGLIVFGKGGYNLLTSGNMFGIFAGVILSVFVIWGGLLLLIREILYYANKKDSQ